ncbi:MAG: HutD family protein [Paracoccaceae bacterium]
MRHLTPADYRTMPWANGRGQTVEMLRVDGSDGLLWRLSMASVVEDGPFSIFPGIERNLTVISGPGFDLVGTVSLRCERLVPVAFAGDVPIAAANVVGACDDFNVMTARALPRPIVQVLNGEVRLAQNGTLALFILGRAVVNGKPMGRHDLVLSNKAVDLTAVDPVIAVSLFR